MNSRLPSPSPVTWPVAILGRSLKSRFFSGGENHQGGLKAAPIFLQEKQAGLSETVVKREGVSLAFVLKTVAI